LGTLFFRPSRRGIASRAIKTHSSQSSLFKRLEVSSRRREVFAAPGAASRGLGIGVGADYDSRTLQRSEWAGRCHTKIEARSEKPEEGVVNVVELRCSTRY